MTGILALTLSALVLATPLQAQSNKRSTPAERTAAYFESLRKTPPQLFAFLKLMPKGGDLHNHLTGSVYAESLIQWSANSGLCVHQITFVLSAPPCDSHASKVPVSNALTNPILYRELVDAFSTRNWQYSGESGHDDFFDSFARSNLATTGHLGPMIAEVASRAARGNVIYLELMVTTGGNISGRLADEVGWNDNFDDTLRKLKSGGISNAVVAASETLRDGEEEKNRILKCGTQQADPGCSVTIRYISQVARADTLSHVFAQMLTGFELASDPNSKVVAVNLVQPEDWLMSMQNFSAQMDMLNFLHSLYPKAHIALHAGELAPGMVPPEWLRFHIRDSVVKGHAERLGHAVSVMYEDNPFELLKELARRNIMIEICLSSAERILGTKGQDHPLATYLQFGVPVALATDDEGVSRSEMTREYLKAAQDHGLGYLQLKTMARTSLQFAFLSGASLWQDAKRFLPVAACAKDLNTGNATSVGCKRFLETSEKAAMQWKLEQAFQKFESQY